MKKLVLSLFSVFSIASYGVNLVQIDGLQYAFKGTSVAVVSGRSYDDQFVDDGKNHYMNYANSSYTIPSQVTYDGTTYIVDKIGSYCFNDGNVSHSYSSKIKSIKLPETITTIGYCAFGGTNISSMIFPKSLKSFSNGGAFRDNDLLTTLIYTSKTAPAYWTATLKTYVPDKVAYTMPSHTINGSSIIEMINFSENTFEYTGQSPTTTWTNNVEGYTASLTMPELEKNVGSYVVYIPVTFTKGSESFSTEVAYRYTIKGVELTAKVNDVSRVYGDNNPAFSITYSGFINGDNESVITTKPTATTTATPTSNVGTYPISISGGVAQNYTLKYETGTLTITKAALEVSVNDATKVYGSENPTFTLNYSGLKNDETIPAWSASPNFKTTATVTSAVGSYPIEMTTGTPRNYEISGVTNGTLSITPAQLTIKAKDVSKIYYEENPSFTYVCTGFVNGDNASTALQVQPTLSTTANQASNVGTYEIIAKDASSNNYNIVYAPGVFSITKRPLVAKVGNFERIYGEENPSFTVEYEGFVGNDSESSLSIKPTAKTTAISTSNVGTYPINVSGGDATNYKFSYTSGVLTINKSEQTIEWNQDLSNVQVGSQVELTAVASSGLPVEYTMDSNNSASLYKVGSKTYIDCIAAGQILLRASQNGNNNYYGTPRVTNAINIVGNTIADPTLTIIQGEKGLIRTQVTKGSVYTFTIEATDGWKIHSVSFNDEDITGKLNDNNRFTTPNINTSTTLNVVYESSADGISSTKVSSAKILGTSFGIKVENARPNEVLKVYTIDGKLVKSQKLQSSEVDVELPNNETYIINLEDLRVKVRL